jgi:hypothetical protein
MDFYARRILTMAILGTTGHERFFDCAAQRSERRSDEITLGRYAQNAVDVKRGVLAGKT